jgi:GDP-4-dehydro-6-deoxy-D-mannose reductase
MRALVTGADGFVGRWLTRHLSEQGDETWLAMGTASHSPHDRGRAVDIRDASAVGELLAWAQPEVIYHLAAIAFGPDARRSVTDAVATTIGGTANLLAAASTMQPTPVVLVPSSAEVYAPPVDGRPITEAHPCRPTGSYGASKLAQEATALAYDLAGAVPVVITRSFNHIGPGQRDVFVVSSFATQLARIVAEGAPAVMQVGNLAVERDFTDVRDVVRAYRLLVIGGHHGQPVNVASGSATGIRDLLQALIRLSGVDVTVEVDPSRLRAVDAPSIVGDATTLSKLTGWQPTIELPRTLSDIWADALSRAGKAELTGS